MSATYKAVMLTRKGGPEALEVVELPVREPAPGEARVRIRACGVGATDVLMRRGYYPFAPKLPFVQGYDPVGVVEAVGSGVTSVRVGDKVAALAVWGGLAELLYRGADELVPVPDGLDDAQVVALILNYTTAYQMVHRVAKQTRGQTALITGANGGVGQALLELLALEGVVTYGAASARSHDLVRALGGIPVESRARPVDESLHALLPEGVDVSYDALGGPYVKQCTRATKRGGHVIAYGFSGAVGKDGTASNLAATLGLARLFTTSKLAGRKTTMFGITQRYRKDKASFLEDLPKLFALLAERKIHPKIAMQMPLLEARKANELIEAGKVDGKIVMVA